MHFTPKNTLALAALILVPTLNTGCIAVAAGAAGAAGYAWYKGEFEATLDGGTKQVTAAAGRALKDLDMKDIKTISTDLDGKVTARSALDKEVVVTITRKSDTLSAVAIRVGTFGDEAMSREIYSKIKARL